MEAPDWRALEERVGKRWSYYAPRFEKFARSGGVSWNWSAFFATLAWLRYRKLYRWSWAYFFFSIPVLLIALMLIAAGDSCERALDPASTALARSVVVGLILVVYIVPPLFADRLYYNHLLATAGPGAPGGTGGAVGPLALQALLVVIAAGLIPSYADYAYRAMVSEGVALAGSLKTPYAEFVKQHDRLPAKIEEIGGATAGRYADRIVIDRDGAIRATFGNNAKGLSGHSVAMAPVRKGSEIEWICRSRDLPNVCLPAACRSERTPSPP